MLSSEFEQRHCVAPCQASLNTGGNIHALKVLLDPENNDASPSRMGCKQGTPARLARA
ncbi:ATP synthase delta chain [Altererythrobacter epoxidivorans]|uniref:ATP synthase delta chain n=1 Tax=Altererythrobacter epoxidivorans TaxID=361183 RepID=A0A0M3TAF2_9SPHN|nr:ATP synthase delta chain [Altererythrobacter epoxidivorans]